MRGMKMRSLWLPPRTDSPVATWILSGIDAMGVKRSLSHRQKGVQVYDTQIMLCDKRQCSWPRGPATSPYHKRPVSLEVVCRPRLACSFLSLSYRRPENKLGLRPLIAPSAPPTHSASDNAPSPVHARPRGGVWPCAADGLLGD